MSPDPAAAFARDPQPSGAIDEIEPFELHVPERELDDLRARLALTRWPDRETVAGSAQGAPLDRVRSLCEHWQHRYDWRRCEALLNGFGQYRTTIDGLAIHFLHVRSDEPDAMPLLLTHGWPGSVLEFRDVIDALVDPVAHGGTRQDAFHVVIPSMPGFGFSAQPTEAGWGIPRIADAWVTLMERLDYGRWAAQGGERGSAVTTVLGHRAPPGLVGIHLNRVGFRPTDDEVAAATAEERAMIADARRYEQTLSGYAKVQATRPQTIGYALADSPAALAAWIYTLFQDVSDSSGAPETVFPMNAMLDDIMLYWLPNAGASSARLYWEGAAMMSDDGPPPGPMRLPAGISMFPGEAVRLSRRWAMSRFANLVHFGELASGGHFAALERPAAFVDELRDTFRSLR